MGAREEFEKLGTIAETLKCGIYYDDRSNSYWSAVGASYVSLARINGAWYAFQEQQKKIDAIKSKLSDIYDASDDGETIGHLLDEIQELLK